MSEFSAVQPAPRGGLKLKQIAILFLLAFVAGGVGTWWLASNYGYLGSDPAPQSMAEAAPATATSGAFAPVVPPVDTVASIESRMSQINADAAAASGNAARAEGLMIAFAARRALDSGAPLGYLSEQLRVRFGATQPQAVSIIVAASQQPITLEALQGELTALGPVLLSGNRESGIWSRLRREVSELFVLRKDGTVAATPTRRFERAQSLMEAGNISGAVAEVSAMPGAFAADDWLSRARRYSEARQALDLLERGALATPLPTPAPPIMQDAPPAQGTAPTP